ncbi:protein kinase-like domain, concanavalin A-like lectin/glucanase domain protein [Tanacetum coccineum]
MSVHSSSYQMKLEKALLDFDSHQEKSLSHLRTQLGQQHDDMIGKINLLWKTIFEKLKDEEWKQKPVKVVLPKVSLSRIPKKLNKNSPALKLRFVNSIIILSKDSDTEEEDVSSTNVHDLDSMMRNREEVREQGKKEVFNDEGVEEVFDDETKEKEDDDTKYYKSPPIIKELVYHEWLLNNPRPSWVKVKIKAGNPSNIKISCMIRHILMKHAYIDINSPINVMSRNQYNRIMTYKLGPRKKPSNLNKISNFVGRVRGLRVFVGSFAYKCDFMILEDTTSVIDGCLGEFAFGRPFIEETGLVSNNEEGIVMFKQDDSKITFKMPHTMEIFKQIRLRGLSTNSIPSFAHEENFSHGRMHYYQSLLIGDEYKQDSGDRSGIRHLMRLEKKIMED